MCRPPTVTPGVAHARTAPPLDDPPELLDELPPLDEPPLELPDDEPPDEPLLLEELEPPELLLLEEATRAIPCGLRASARSSHSGYVTISPEINQKAAARRRMSYGVTSSTVYE
jgi:hypothetical protein